MNLSVSLQYAVQMVTSSSLESQIWLWIKQNKKEDRRLEFKLRIDLSTPGAKAEFIRDLIALANSDGEHPRSEGYLVVGFRNGQRHDIKDEHYDGARFGQLLSSYIYPPVETVYEEFGNKRRGHIGILIVRPDADAIYVVNKKLTDDRGHHLLHPGQSWGRKSDRKVELGGQAIAARMRDILDRKIDEATSPLKARVSRLESESGPSLEVKQIRFAMEASPDWDNVDVQLDKLIPYAREFDHAVKNEVLDAVMEATGRTRRGMPVFTARVVDGVLGELMPVGFGGMRRPSRREISNDDLKLLERIEYAAFELTWDACRYLRDIAVVDVASRRYWTLIRFATLNRLDRFQTECLKNARYCEQICLEERMGKAFTEAHRKLNEEIAGALDAFDCRGYSIKTVSATNLKDSDFAACLSIIKTGDAVDLRSARNELPWSTLLAIASKGEKIVGIAAIKRHRPDYAADIAKKSGVDFPSGTLELGYVAVMPEHRGNHLSHCLVKAVVNRYSERLFATTATVPMKRALTNCGFENKGKEWKGRNDQMLSFWERTPQDETT